MHNATRYYNDKDELKEGQWRKGSTKQAPMLSKNKGSSRRAPMPMVMRRMQLTIALSMWKRVGMSIISKSTKRVSVADGNINKGKHQAKLHSKDYQHKPTKPVHSNDLTTHYSMWGRQTTTLIYQYSEQME